MDHKVYIKFILIPFFLNKILSTILNDLGINEELETYLIMVRPISKDSFTDALKCLENIMVNRDL
jgi:hypothetical protein